MRMSLKRREKSLPSARDVLRCPRAHHHRSHRSRRRSRAGGRTYLGRERRVVVRPDTTPTGRPVSWFSPILTSSASDDAIASPVSDSILDMAGSISTRRRCASTLENLRTTSLIITASSSDRALNQGGGRSGNARQIAEIISSVASAVLMAWLTVVRSQPGLFEAAAFISSASR